MTFSLSKLQSCVLFPFRAFFFFSFVAVDYARSERSCLAFFPFPRRFLKNLYLAIDRPPPLEFQERKDEFASSFAAGKLILSLLKLYRLRRQ